jgi:fused signal recognition particle receptor
VKIIDGIEKRVAQDKYVNTNELNRILKEEIQSILVDAPQDTSYINYELPSGHKPHVILVVGVNGVGKTTTIGKLAHNFSLAGKSVLLGAADTFRAAAVDQLNIWSERTNVPIVKHAMGSDPSAVAFDAVQSGIARNVDVVIIDTAGRLHNKIHLMDELNKIKRSVNKALPGAPHEVMLVLDGSTGQNALEQARHFTAATEVTALTITKLDGTAKGGVVLAIADQFKIPVKFIGVGEKATDLLVFDKIDFVDSLFGGVK